MTYDRMVFGMHHLNISQIGSMYDGQNHYTHTSYEIDCCGSDKGVDYYFNKLPNTCFKCTGRFGTKSTGNTFFFVTCDAYGVAKKVLCADGVYRVITLALTHSGWTPTLGKIYPYNAYFYMEGVSGKASGNHIHVECCEGLVVRKVVNAKGYWNLPNMMDVRKVFWILDGWTTVVNTQGLTFKHTKEVPVKEEEDEPMYFYADTMPCRIRAKLQFHEGKPVAKIVATMPKGAKAKITHCTNRHELDGFEWFQVEYTTPTGSTVAGYVQGDLNAYLIKRV